MEFMFVVVVVVVGVCVCITYLSEDLHMKTHRHTADSTPSEALYTGPRKTLAKNAENVMFYLILFVIILFLSLKNILKCNFPNVLVLSCSVGWHLQLFNL